MEATSFGIPVIATNTGGTSEIVDNKNGALIDVDFEPVKVAKKIDHIRKLDINDYLKLREESRKKWEERFEAISNYKEFAKKIKEPKNEK